MTVWHAVFDGRPILQAVVVFVPLWLLVVALAVWPRRRR